MNEQGDMFRGLEDQGERKGWIPMGWGLGVNAVLILGFVMFGFGAVRTSKPLRPGRWVSLAMPMAPEVAIARPRLPEPPPMRASEGVALRPKAKPAPSLPANLEINRRHFEMPPPALAIPNVVAAASLTAALPSQVLPAPVPKPTVGTFADPSSRAQSLQSQSLQRQPIRALPEVVAADFGSQVARVGLAKSTQAITEGTFGNAPVRQDFSYKPSPAVVESGFAGAGSNSSRSSTPRSNRELAGVEFGMSEPAAAGRRPLERAVLPSSFETRAAAQNRPTIPKVEEGEIQPVEILSKPRPQYTSEARRNRVEGEVQVQVLFGIDGKIKVLSIVKGLGHGLDENAALAVAQIQFLPARRRGTPIEQPAVVRVQFQLAQ